MKEYQIEVTTVTTVYVVANNEAEAMHGACEMALMIEPDSSDAVIVATTEV